MTKRTPTDGTSDTDPGAERRRERLADPDDSSHFDPAIAPDTTDQWGMVADGDYRPVPNDLGFVPPPDEAEAADPTPPTPDAPAASVPTTVEADHPAAGSGGGSGRPSSEMAQAIELERLERVRPDASEAVLGAAMGVINPAADPAFAITHAEESARVLVVGQHVGNMFQAIADKHLVNADDVRVVYRKMRQIAATHGIDLDGGQ